VNSAIEPHSQDLASRLNWLRAGVLGANDGIVSVAGIVVLVAGATATRGSIYTAGLGGLVGGAVSMALGEYVSVSSQRDSERAQIATEIEELDAYPEDELDELIGLWQARGLTPSTARLVAVELTAKDALAAHLDAELNLNPDQLANPASAALASVIAFTLGGLLPLLAILLAQARYRIGLTSVVVLLALLATGTVSARLGQAPIRRAAIRVLIGGAAGLALTYWIGRAFGTMH
jgi:VIT1/CCC1 family predicted Fe2+/Mn2+ transporter